jgi:hypothetical protein
LFKQKKKKKIQALTMKRVLGADQSVAKRARSAEVPASILLVTVLDCHYPVSIEILHNLFSYYGKVQKIILLSKSNQFASLIQMASVEAASNARTNLEGKEIFQGCCRMSILFSNLPSVIVKENGPRARDFTQIDTSAYSFSPSAAAANPSAASSYSFSPSAAVANPSPFFGGPPTPAAPLLLSESSSALLPTASGNFTPLYQSEMVLYISYTFIYLFLFSFIIYYYYKFLIIYLLDSFIYFILLFIFFCGFINFSFIFI